MTYNRAIGILVILAFSFLPSVGRAQIGPAVPGDIAVISGPSQESQEEVYATP